LLAMVISVSGWSVYFSFRVTGVGEGSLQLSGTAFALPWCAGLGPCAESGRFGL